MEPDPKHRYYELTVSEVVDETAEARSFAFEIPEELRALFHYRAGQFLTFRVPWGGMELQRSYSLCSSPEWDDGHRVTVKRIEDGRVSNWFNDELRPGDRIQVLPPEGRFVLRESERPIVHFSAGSGITPVLSLLKSALVSTGRRMKLVYANQDRETVIFASELERLAGEYPERFELVHHLDVDRGFLDVGGAQAHLAGWADADFYLCGPDPFMEVVEAALDAIGAARERVFIERFVSPTDPDRIAAAPPAEATPEGPVPEKILFHLDGKSHEIPYEPGLTLLETARAAGLAPPFACTEGYCSTCMARLVRGSVHLRANDALSERDLREGFILTCQGVPTSAECEVDWDV